MMKGRARFDLSGAPAPENHTMMSLTRLTSLPVRDREPAPASEGAGRSCGVPAPEKHTMSDSNHHSDHSDTGDTGEPQSAAVIELGRCFHAGDISRARRDQRLLELRFASLRRTRSREFQLVSAPPVTFYCIEDVTPTAVNERSLHHV